jgi:chemotaxis protein methyltransferase CheR
MNEHFDKIAAYLKSRSRLSFSGHKRVVLRHRLETRLQQLQLPDFSAYWERLRGNPDEERQLFELATTNETSFFRNPGQFAFLKENIIPLLEERAAQGNSSIRILSAGCSSGEEPYSIAMTALEALTVSENIQLEIVAGDINMNCLDIARNGFYEPGKLKAFPDGYKERFMTMEATGYRVKDTLKKRIRFIRLNLDDLMNSECPSWNHGLGLFDIIFCRNVMIYFAPPCQQKLVDTLYRLMLPEGYLFTGDAEPLHLFSHEFLPVAEAGCLIYQKTERPINDYK